MILSAKSHSAPASKSIQSDVLQAIYGSLSSPLLSHALGTADSMTGAGAGTDHDRVQVGGSVWIHGRELSEWSLKALRERITFMKDGELDLSLPAGNSLTVQIFRSVCILAYPIPLHEDRENHTFDNTLSATDEMLYYVISHDVVFKHHSYSFFKCANSLPQ